MKHLTFLIPLVLILVSCGTDGRHFKLDGRFQHLNQGEFYVYNLEGNAQKLDTIKVESGRFTYETVCEQPMTLMMIFPNFTEQPIFAQPGKSVDIKGDASHLKEMTVKGTKDNELMNAFRASIVSVSPDEARRNAAKFINDHPASPVGNYLVRKYFIQTDQPDYEQATALIRTMLAAQPDNGYLRRLQRSLKGLSSVKVGSDVPRFSATDINGKSVGTALLTSAPKAVVCAWASWNYESVNLLRTMYSLQKTRNFVLFTVCLDASVKDCRKTLEGNQLTCPTVCDGQMIRGNVYRLLGMSKIPDNLVIEGGRITKSGLDYSQLQKEVNGWQEK